MEARRTAHENVAAAWIIAALCSSLRDGVVRLTTGAVHSFVCWCLLVYYYHGNKLSHFTDNNTSLITFRNPRNFIPQGLKKSINRHHFLFAVLCRRKPAFDQGVEGHEALMPVDYRILHFEGC